MFNNLVNCTLWRTDCKSALAGYSYVLNNPLRFTDPSGFVIQGGDDDDKKDKGFQPEFKLPSFLEKMKEVSDKITKQWNDLVNKTNTSSISESLFGKSKSGFAEDNKVSFGERLNNLFKDYAGAYFYGDGDKYNYLDSPPRKHQLDSYDIKDGILTSEKGRYDIFGFGNTPENPHPIGYPPATEGSDTMIGNAENGGVGGSDWSRDSTYYFEITIDGKTDRIIWFYPWDAGYNTKFMPK